MVQLPLDFFQFPLRLLVQEKLHDFLVEPLIWLADPPVLGISPVVLKLDEGWGLDCPVNLFDDDLVLLALFLLFFLSIAFLHSRPELSNSKQLLFQLALYLAFVANCVNLTLSQQRVFDLILFGDLPGFRVQKVVLRCFHLLDLTDAWQDQVEGL